MRSAPSSSRNSRRRVSAVALVLIGGACVASACSLAFDSTDFSGGTRPDAALTDAPSDGNAIDAAADSPSDGPVIPPKTRPLFYLDLNRTTNATIVPMVAFPDTDAAPVPIGCPVVDKDNLVFQSWKRSGNFVARSYPPLLSFNRAYYPGEAQQAPGDSLFIYNAGIGDASAILAVDETSRCDAGLRRVDPFDVDAGLQAFEFPRFRRDGKRVAYVGRREIADAGELGVYTVGTDGKDPRSLGVESPAIADTPPAWVESQAVKRVMWLERNGQIRIQDDAPAAQRQDVAYCGTNVLQIDYLKAGPYEYVIVDIADHISTFTFSSGDCDARKGLIASDPPDVIEKDFAISPDSKHIAYVSNRNEVTDSEVPHTHLWIVDSEGKQPPVACTQTDPSYDDVGPQWYAGGTQLVWTRLARPGETSSSALMIADVANGTCQKVRPVVAASPIDGGVHLVIGSANSGCNAGGATGPGGGWWLVALGAIAARLRRRVLARA